jgi:transglutaminase-like putative cysteine protease
MKFVRRDAALALAAALAAAAFASAPAPRPAPDVVRGETRRFLVHFEDVVRNEGSAPLRDVRCDALLPLDSGRQRVRWIRLSPHGWDVRRDAHGETVASARVAQIGPGEAACFSWIASVDLAAEEHAPAASLAVPAPPEPARYLGDGPAFGIASDAVAAAADEARRRAGSDVPLALAESAAAVVRERVRFELSGGWDAAPVVLERGSGSCSESTFAFVAVCRRLGLPARWAGGTMLRAGAPGRTCDPTFHRIAEVWLPEHGWWPVETQGARADDASADASRPLGRPFLLLARGDGTSDGAIGTAYHARERWSRSDVAAGARPRVSKRAWWLAGVDDDLVLRGSETGLAEGAVPSFARAELMACDARGFGPPLDASGNALLPASAAGVADRAAAAERLLRAGQPEGLRLAAEGFADDPAALRALAEEHCDETLAEEFLAAATSEAAGFEAWWAQVGPRVRPVARGRLELAAE